MVPFWWRRRTICGTITKKAVETSPFYFAGDSGTNKEGERQVFSEKEGNYMALLGRMPTVDALGNFSSRFELGCKLLERGAHADAYVLFSALYRERAHHTAALYNLALCHVAAGEWEPCLRLLERAMVQLRKTTGVPPARDATYQTLAKRQAAGRGYLFPLPESAPTLAPEYTRECVLRLLVDACSACSMWEQIPALAQQLPHQEYINVQSALKLVQEQE